MSIQKHVVLLGNELQQENIFRNMKGEISVLMFVYTVKSLI